MLYMEKKDKKHSKLKKTLNSGHASKGCFLLSAYLPVEQAVHLDPVVAGGGPAEVVVLIVG